MIAFRSATGLFMPMVGASLFATIADYFPVEERTRVTGYVTSAAPVALLLALMLGGAMMLVAPTERASLNAMLNAVYQLGGALGGMASAWLFAMSPGYGANAAVAAALLLATGLMRRRIAGRAASKR